MRAITLIIPWVKGVVENSIYYIQNRNVKIIINDFDCIGVSGVVFFQFKYKI